MDGLYAEVCALQEWSTTIRGRGTVAYHGFPVSERSCPDLWLLDVLAMKEALRLIRSGVPRSPVIEPRPRDENVRQAQLRGAAPYPLFSSFSPQHLVRVVAGHNLRNFRSAGAFMTSSPVTTKISKLRL
jgi:hypothetical protein